MALERTPDNTPVGLTKLAEEAHQQCNGERDKAVLLLWEWIEGDKALWDRLIRPIIEDSLYGAVGRVDSKTRHHLRAVARRDDDELPPAPARVPNTSPPPPLPMSRRETPPVERPAPNPDRGLAGMEAMALRTLYEWPLPGGKILGDAIKHEVAHARKQIGQVSRTYATDERFLGSIEAMLPDGAIVRNVLPLATLVRLRREAAEK